MGQHIFFADRTVLLVEDEIYTAESLRKQLNVLGFGRILVASDLVSAKKLAEENSLDVALLDVNLRAGEVSLQFGRELSADGVPVVYYSGFNAEEMMLATRGQEFMEKPISLPRLKAAILRAILRVAPPAQMIQHTKMAGQMARQ
jgi:DNA-binding response OmpR family regulator